MRVIFNRKGVALILVLGSLLVLLGLGIGFVRFVSLQSDLGNPIEDRVRARMSAESGVALALHRIHQFYQNQPLRVVAHDQDFFHFENDEQGFEVAVEDLNGKVNLNQAPWGSQTGAIAQFFLQQLPGDVRASWSDTLLQQRIQQARWWTSLHELTLPLQQNRPRLVSVLQEQATVWGADWNYDDQRNPRWNLATLRQRSLSFQEESRFLNLYAQQDEAYRVLSALVDYIDSDDQPLTVQLQQGGVMFGDEPRALINEARYQTSEVISPVRNYSFPHSFGGEFVEIYNPYPQAVSLQNYRLEWTSRGQGQQSLALPNRVLPPGGFIVVTDSTKRLQFLDHVDVALIEEVAGFELAQGQVALVHHGVREVFDLSLDVAVDQSIEKDDPRSNRPGNDHSGFSPGRMNGAFAQSLPQSAFSEQRRAFVRFDDVAGAQAPLAFLPYIYRGDAPWSYLRLQSEAVNDANQNGILDDDEAGDFVLLQRIVFQDQNSPRDYYDEQDGVGSGFRHRQSGRININTASAEVLSFLPGVSRDLADRIVRYREAHFSQGGDVEGFRHTYDMILPLKEALNADDVDRLFWSIQDRITVRTHYFRIKSQGIFHDAHYELEVDVEQPLALLSGQVAVSDHPKILSKKVRRL